MGPSYPHKTFKLTYGSCSPNSGFRFSKVDKGPIYWPLNSPIAIPTTIPAEAATHTRLPSNMHPLNGFASVVLTTALSRAPNLDELFKPQRSDFQSGTDPCDSTLNPSQEVKDFCVLQGVPAADIDTFVAGGIGFVARRGGNPNLEPEESDTVTLGFVLSPPLIEGLNITVDWFAIDIEDAVTATSGQTVTSSCFATLDLNSEFCTGITRFPNGTLNEVLAISSNFATFKVSGVDLSFDYARELPDSWGIGSNGAALSVRGLGQLAE